MIDRRLFLASAAAVPVRAAAAGPTAETAFGLVRGRELDAGIKVFKGIPYGASTAGPRRFMPPADPAKWTGTRDAFDFGSRAPQRATLESGEGEDCLVLNVWTPATGTARKRPVMFWCHGGGFATGSGAGAMTDGANLARRGDVVVVTINHRLNVLGFANLAEYGGDEFARSGTVGMLDIVKALEWVRSNIAQFGGDPANVMIFGQSGGGRKVATLLAMPSAKGLFHRSCIESGATIRLVEPDQSTRVAALLMARLGVEKSQVRQLQQLPLDRIMSAYFDVLQKDMAGADPMTQGFSPTVDGRVIPQHPFHPHASPVSADVPLLIGSTRTELTSQAGEASFRLDDEALRARIGALLGQHASPAIDLYRKLNPGALPSDLYFLIASDHRYSAPVMKIAERRAALGKGPVYQYYFRWETPVQGGRLKSPHTIEVPFAFDNVKLAANLTGGGPEAVALAGKVSDAWIAFARTGNPNTPKLPRWPAFNAAQRPTMVIDTASRVENDPLRQQRILLFKALALS